MGRLGKLKPLVATMRSSVQSTHVDRDEARPDRKWYRIARWTAKPNGLRWQVLLRDMFKCQMCGVTVVNSSELVADHIIPHNGDANLFWNPANIQCLCWACHSSAKQREERKGRPATR